MKTRGAMTAIAALLIMAVVDMQGRAAPNQLLALSARIMAGLMPIWARWPLDTAG